MAHLPRTAGWGVPAAGALSPAPGTPRRAILPQLRATDPRQSAGARRPVSPRRPAGPQHPPQHGPAPPVSHPRHCVSEAAAAHSPAGHRHLPAPSRRSLPTTPSLVCGRSPGALFVVPPWPAPKRPRAWNGLQPPPVRPAPTAALGRAALGRGTPATLLLRGLAPRDARGLMLQGAYRPGRTLRDRAASSCRPRPHGVNAFVERLRSGRPPSRSKGTSGPHPSAPSVAAELSSTGPPSSVGGKAGSGITWWPAPTQVLASFTMPCVRPGVALGTLPRMRIALLFAAPTSWGGLEAFADAHSSGRAGRRRCGAVYHRTRGAARAQPPGAPRPPRTKGVECTRTGPDGSNGTE